MTCLGTYLKLRAQSSTIGTREAQALRRSADASSVEARISCSSSAVKTLFAGRKAMSGAVCVRSPSWCCS